MNRALPNSSLQHWAVLAAVVDQGGFAQAAAVLNRSQSAVSYAVSRLQEEMGLQLLALEGRKAKLTPHGQTLLQRARVLLREINTLETLGRSLKQGWEAELNLVVDAAFPRERLLKIIAEIQQLCPNTRVQVCDAVLSGAEEAITEGGADVVVTSRIPSGYLGDFLLDITFVAVARAGHPLFDIDHPLTADDLMRYAQVVVRDSGTQHPRDDGWLGAERRFTVSSLEASFAMVEAGLGYAWLPEHLIAAALQNRTLRPLLLAVGSTRSVALHLVLVHPDVVGPAARAAVECFQRHLPAMRS